MASLVIVGRGGVVALAVLAGLVAGAAPGALAANVPPTRTDNVEDMLHGVRVVDPYRWLEDQQSPETRAWIDAENAYTKAVLTALPGRDRIQRRIAALKHVDAFHAPDERSGRYFFMKRLAGQDQYGIYMRAGVSGGDELLIDPHPLSADHTVNLEVSSISADGRLVAYGIRQGGEDETAVKFFDVDRRQDLADQLPRADYYAVCLTRDGSSLYYAHHDSTGNQVMRHVMGTDVSRDAEIFGEGYGPEVGIDVALSDDDRYLIANIWHGSASSNDVYLIDLAAGGKPQPVVEGIDASFEPRLGGNWLFFKTDWQAPRGRVIRVDLAKPRQSAWRVVVPEGEDIIDGMAVAGGKILVTYIHNAIPSVAIFEADGKRSGVIDPPAIGYLGDLSGRWESNEVFFTFSSYHIPTRIYNYFLDDGTTAVWARINAPFVSENFTVEQVWYKSRDGTRVPMFVGHSKNIKLDGSNPTLLTGYGGFRSSAMPYYATDAALWLSQGGVYAEPCLRGGSEFGEEWHRTGMLDKKQNTFDDFIAAAEWLVMEGYTDPERLAISGGSNGGLLVGAALTQRPDLFRAVICSYPLLDMLRYHKFLVAAYWVPEYGSADDPDQFKYIKAYSPYHNVRLGVEYPAVLFITGDADTRVAPLHARKMTALLQASTASDPGERPVLLRYDTKAGHSGGTPVTKQIEDLTDEMLFLDWQLGVKY
jgi:prolyl oligopeptidase